MAAKGNTQLFTGVRGLITEATDTNYPADACTDLLNVDLDLDGSITTRPGIDQESGGTSVTFMPDQFGLNTNTENYVAAIGAVRQTYTWENVASLRGVNIEVVRIGTRLYLFLHTAVLSSQPQVVVVLDGTGLIRDTQVLSESQFDFASGNGRLYCANKGCNPFYVEFDEGLTQATVRRVDIEIRDFEGVDDGLEVDTRPSTLSPEHNYNLLNQGWPNRQVTVVRNRVGDSTALAFPISGTEELIGVYPSNADQYYLAKATSAEIPSAIGSYSPFVLNDFQFGTTNAPKGHFIVNAFNIERPLLLPELYAERPQAVGFYAGRVWWSGVENNQYGSSVFFSQSGDDADKAGKCYQEADPTAEEINDLVATDGGVIPVQEMSTVLAMRPLGNFLILFAVNGVWAVSGAEGGNFSANNASVQKVSSNGCVSTNSIVEVGNSLYYFGKTAIYGIAPDSAGLSIGEQNITETTIKRFYNAIPASARQSAKGVASEKKGKIYWAYNDGLVVDSYDYRQLLILDVRTGAYTVYRISEDPDLRVCGVVDIDDFTVGRNDDNIVTTNEDVDVTLNDDNTLVTVEGGLSIADIDVPRIKMLCIERFADAAPHGILFAEFRSIEYYDWPTRANVAYEHYFDMGFNSMGANSTKGAPIYINSFFDHDLGIVSTADDGNLPPEQTTPLIEQIEQCRAGEQPVIGATGERGYKANTNTVARYTLEPTAYLRRYNQDNYDGENPIYTELQVVQTVEPEPYPTGILAEPAFTLLYWRISIDNLQDQYKLAFKSEGDGSINDGGYISVERAGANWFRLVWQAESGTVTGEDGSSTEYLARRKESPMFRMEAGKYYYLQAEWENFGFFVTVFEDNMGQTGVKGRLLLDWDIGYPLLWDLASNLRTPSVRFNYVGFNSPGLNIAETFHNTWSTSGGWNRNDGTPEFEYAALVFPENVPSYSNFNNYITFDDSHEADNWGENTDGDIAP